MDDKELYTCISKLTSKWKDHFGLHTYYVGYLTAELLISLFYVWRTSEVHEFEGLSGQEITRLIDDKIAVLNMEQGINLSRFRHDRDIEDFMPKLIEELKHYDLSEESLSNEKWNELIEHLMKKAKN